MISSLLGGLVIAGILTLAGVDFWVMAVACVAWGLFCGVTDAP